MTASTPRSTPRRALARVGLWGALVGALGWLGISLALALAPACRSDAATADHCAAILDRIVELELREQGYRDPALTARKRAEFRRLFADQLGECVGRRLPPGAMECVAAATSAEQISHVCLR